MKKPKIAPIHCVYCDFIDWFPPGHQPTLPNLVQRSRRGTFPKYVRLEGKRSPALFIRAEILEYAERTFGAYFPDCVAELRKALGLKKSGKAVSHAAG